MDWSSMGIVKWKVEEHKVSKIWKRTPVATCDALVKSKPKVSWAFITLKWLRQT